METSKDKTGSPKRHSATDNKGSDMSEFPFNCKGLLSLRNPAISSKILRDVPVGISLISLVFDDKDNCIDFICEDANETFVHYLTCDSFDLIKKRASEIFLSSLSEDIIKDFAIAVQKNKSFKFSINSLRTQRNIRFLVQPLGKNNFTLTILEIYYLNEIRHGYSRSRIFNMTSDYSSSVELWYDMRGSIKWISPEVEDITGYRPDYYYGKDTEIIFQSLTHPEDQSYVMESFQKVIKEKVKARDIQFRIYTSSGDLKWIRQDFQPIFDPEGQYIGIRSTWWDITGTRSLHTLNESLHKSLSIAATSTDIRETASEILSCLSDILPNKGLIFFVKDPCLNQLKLLASVSLPEKMQELMSTVDINSSDTVCGSSVRLRKILVVEDISKSDEYPTLQNFYKQCNAESFWACPIITYDDRLLGCFSLFSSKLGRPSEIEMQIMKTIKDVSIVAIERYLALEKLASQKEHLESLANNIPGVVFTATISDKIRFQFLNNYINKTYTISGDDILAGNIQIEQIIHGDDYPGIIASIQNAVKSNQPFNVEFRVLASEGRIRWFNAQGYGCHNKYTDSIFVEGVALDITESKENALIKQKLADRILQKSEEMQQVLRAVSHDLRTPLVNIQGFSCELESAAQRLTTIFETMDSDIAFQEELKLILENDIPEFVRYINAGTSKMNSLLTSLSNVSKLGRADLQLVETDVKSILTNVIETLSFQLKEINANIKVHSLPYCIADRFQISQVLLNLISNAIKYSHPERNLELDIDGWIENNYATYCISDNGIGIPESKTERVFEIFYRTCQLDRVTGDGLGLFLVKQILERHNGSISVESEEGKGSKFYFTLPISQ